MGEVLKKSRSAPDAAQTNLGKNLIKIGYIIFLYQMENSTNFGSGENFPAAMKMSASRQMIWSYEGL